MSLLRPCCPVEAGEVVPSSRLMSLENGWSCHEIHDHSSTRRVLIALRREIGGTWLAGSTQRTHQYQRQTAALDYALPRSRRTVDLKTDARNERSRAAISRIGATFEGCSDTGPRRWWREKAGAASRHGDLLQSSIRVARGSCRSALDDGQIRRELVAGDALGETHNSRSPTVGFVMSGVRDRHDRARNAPRKDAGAIGRSSANAKGTSVG